MDLVNFLEEKHSTKSDFSLIDNLRDLTNLVYNTDVYSDIEKGGFSARYRKGGISYGLLESMMGQTFDIDDITVTETDSFQYGDKSIVVMEAINEDSCFVKIAQSDYIEEVNIKNEKGKKLNIPSVNDVCVMDNGDLFVLDSVNECIVLLSSSNTVSTLLSTYPLKPDGICQSTEGGLLVTLRDPESELYQPVAHSRRLVRHVTLTGVVIREYEYKEDGRTRLFTYPRRVRQNGNTDVCVVNGTSNSAGELVILSISGSLRNIYSGQKVVEEFKPTDVVCDSHCNIIVNDLRNSKIHLLSPGSEFLKHLLSKNEQTHPFSMCLYKSTLWVGDYHGLVRVFQYNET